MKRWPQSLIMAQPKVPLPDVLVALIEPMAVPEATDGATVGAVTGPTAVFMMRTQAAAFESLTPGSDVPGLPTCRAQA